MESRGGVRVEGLWQSYQPPATGARQALGFRRERAARWALRDVTLRVEPGERLGLVGPNGAGKSTLLASIAGVLRPSRGTVAVDGRIASVIVPEVGPHRDLTGREHLMVAGVMLGLRRRELRERIPAILELSGIGDEAIDKPLRTYSTGMVARLEFALAMRSDAAVVVLDEHLGAVDESFRARLAAGLDELSARGGAVVLASHDLDLVKELCDRAGLVERGSLTGVGPVVEIVEGYARRRATAGLAAVPPEDDRAAAIG